MDISSVSRREVLRYLGYRGQAEPDRAVADEIEMCLGLLAEKAEPRHACSALFYWSWARSMRFVLTGFIQAADSFLKIWQAAVKFLFLPLHWGWGQII